MTSCAGSETGGAVSASDATAAEYRADAHRAGAARCVQPDQFLGESGTLPFAVDSDADQPASGAPAADLELLVFAGDDVRSFALPRSGSVTIGRGEQSALR